MATSPRATGPTSATSQSKCGRAPTSWRARSASTRSGWRWAAALWAENESVKISPDAQIYGPVWFGENVKIKGGAILMGPTVIREHTVVDMGTSQTSTGASSGATRTSGSGPRSGAPSSVGSAAFGRRRWSSTARSSATIPPSARARVFSREVKNWPDKEVEDGATVTTSLIWGSRGKRTLFGRFGMTGQVNIDMTPEFAARFGAAYRDALYPRDRR